MKKQSLLLFACLFTALGFSQERLIGQVKNTKSDHILLERPYQGKYLPGQSEKIPLSHAGKFEVILEGTSTGFVLLRIEGQKLRAFVAPSTSNTLELEANAKDLSGSAKFSGHLAAENNFLQTLPRLDLGGKSLTEVNNPFFHLGDSPKDAWVTVTDYSESEEKLLKKAAKEGEFSEAFAKAAEQDIAAYYHSIFGNVAYRQWKAALQEAPYRFDAGWSNYWKKINAEDCIDDLPAAVSEWYLVYLDQYIREYQLDFQKDSEFADADAARGEQYLEYDRLIWKYFKKTTIKEYAAAGILAQGMARGKGEPILSELVDKFTADFPDSKFSGPLSAMLNSVPATTGKPSTNEPSTTVFANGINVLGEEKEINSIRDLVSNFKGKVVYMDIWATWCAPCMFELSQHEPLDKFSKGKDIVLLYVSVDDEERRGKWQKVIEDKNLTGYHILTNYALRDELIQQFGDGANLALPTYLIFDKKGKLVERNAKQPSHNTLLFNQLEQYLR